ncbi:MAG: hypothetical protein ACP5HQ_06105 [Thermoprotei archaeon]
MKIRHRHDRMVANSAQEYATGGPLIDNMISVIKDVNTVLSYFPYQVARGSILVESPDGARQFVPTITIRIRRFLIFSFQDTFKVHVRKLNEQAYVYTLTSDLGNTIEVFIGVAHERGSGGPEIKVSAVYNGQKAWVIEKFIDELVRIQPERLKEAAKRASAPAVPATPPQAGKIDLSRTAIVSRIIMKSRLVEQAEASIRPGQALDVIKELVWKYSNKYKGIYVSGVSENTIFRLLFLNGELAGVYVNYGGQFTSDLRALKGLSGTFRVNVYVSLTPEIL